MSPFGVPIGVDSADIQFSDAESKTDAAPPVVGSHHRNTTPPGRTHRFSDETTNRTNLTNQSDIRMETEQKGNKKSMSVKRLRRPRAGNIRVIRRIRDYSGQCDLAP
jgi:hypothetical protein